MWIFTFGLIYAGLIYWAKAFFNIEGDSPLWIGMALIFIIPMTIAYYGSKWEKERIFQVIDKLENEGIKGKPGVLKLIKLFRINDANDLLQYICEFSNNNEQPFRDQRYDIEKILRDGKHFAATEILGAEFEVLNEITREIIRIHGNTLINKYKQTVYEDDYGNVIFKDFYSEIDYFRKNVLEKNIVFERILNDLIKNELASIYMADAKANAANKLSSERLQEIEYLCKEAAIASLKLLSISICETNIQSFINSQKNLNVLDQEEDRMSPFEYESYCLEQLVNAGWKARLTKKGADQGADILAKNDNISVVVQCKKYTHPVGNKAVQEAIAAREYYQADTAIVVSNCSFTISARQLASASDVLLMHHNDLKNFSPEEN